MSWSDSRARFRGMDTWTGSGTRVGVAARVKERTRGANNDVGSRSRVIIENGKRTTPSRSNPAITDPKITTWSISFYSENSVSAVTDIHP